VQVVTHRHCILVPNQNLCAHSGRWSLTAEGRKYALAANRRWTTSVFVPQIVLWTFGRELD
jgi:hypothetical protein